MIKRRLYKQEHADKNDVSDSSSSSSDSELEAEAIEETEAEDDAIAEVKGDDESSSMSSGYQSEDGSENEVDVDSSGLLINDNDFGTGNDRQNLIGNQLSIKGNAEIVETHSNIVEKKDSVPADVAGCILKCKSVFKCKLCPRIVCLTEETLRTHLKSKRHARSEKLLNEGRLKYMLNSDGEIEGETHAERHARIVGLAQDITNPKGKSKGRQRQRERFRRKRKGDGSNVRKARQLTKNPAKKRRKTQD